MTSFTALSRGNCPSPTRNPELTLREMLDDPIIQALMRRDQVLPSDILGLFSRHKTVQTEACV